MNRISEEEFESERERRSSPPGTIGDAQDIMSENIESSLKLFRRKQHGHPHTIKDGQTSQGTAFESKLIETNLKVVRERIPLPTDNKHTLTFKKVYDRLFKDFKDKLVQEYAMMKNAYLTEYEGNYQANVADMKAHIVEIQNHIVEKEEDISEKKERYDALKHKIFTLLRQKYNLHVKKVYFNEIVYHTQLFKREKRLNAYSKNYMYRRNMRLLFCSWRGVTHRKFKKRINRESVEYERKQRDKELAQWDKEVEALKVYMAQLQEKIRIEVQAREELARTYELSLNRGVVQLNEETRSLSENPLVKEISLLVAQELINKSRHDPNIAGILSQSA